MDATAQSGALCSRCPSQRGVSCNADIRTGTETEMLMSLTEGREL